MAARLNRVRSLNFTCSRLGARRFPGWTPVPCGWAALGYEGDGEVVRAMQRLAILALLILVPMRADAYVDPGSGMLIWQGLVALLGAALMFVRKPWQVLKGWLRRLRGK